MNIWSFVLFLNPLSVAMQQLPAPKGCVTIRIPAMERQKDIVQCTIYNSRHEMVRMIPLEGGHHQGLYTLQLKTLLPGTYLVRAGRQELAIELE